MNIVTDHFTLQGKSLLHLEHGCQDYAYSFTDGDLSVALVSDGCSSAPNSDVGARLLVLTAGKLIRDWLPNRVSCDDGYLYSYTLRYELGKLLAQELSLVFSMLNDGAFLGPMLLDCTLVLAVRYKARLFTCMFGDGFICVEFMDGTAGLYQLDYQASFDGVRRSAPNYLAYKMPVFEARAQAYAQARPVAHHNNFAYLGGWLPPVDNTNNDPESGLAFLLRWDDVRSITVSSDGIGSFNADGSLNMQVVDQLLRYPANSKGCILRRKMLYNSTRVWPNVGLKHQDDLGLAAIMKQH